MSMSKLYAEGSVLVLGNSRCMVAVTSAFPKLLWWQACSVSIVSRWVGAKLTLSIRAK